MDTQLAQAFMAQRAAASHAVAGALAPRGASSTANGVAHAAATGTGTGSSASTDASSTITSDDFLTLLVSELKNQDPTQPTDPNQYITQLAQVNSLEQLIQINSGISQLDSSVPTTSSSGSSRTSGSGSGAAAQPATASSHPVFAPATTTSVASQIHKPS